MTKENLVKAWLTIDSLFAIDGFFQLGDGSLEDNLVLKQTNIEYDLGIDPEMSYEIKKAMLSKEV